MMVMAVDLGTRRVGIAVSDARGQQAFPRAILPAGTHRAMAAAVAEVAAREGAELVVVGLALNMDGTDGPMARRCRRFAEELSALGVKVALQDERLSSFAAESLARSGAGRGTGARSASARSAGRRMDRTGRSRPTGAAGRAGAGAVDDLAAAVILSDYLRAMQRAPARGEAPAGSPGPVANAGAADAEQARCSKEAGHET